MISARTLTALVTAVVLALLAAACGGGDDDTPTPAGTPAEPTVSQPGNNQSGDGDEHGHDAGTPLGGTRTAGTPVGQPTAASGAIKVGTVGTRQVLTTEDGYTLYVFDNDPPNAGTTACFASCAMAWPPLIVSGAPTGPAELTAGLSTITRETESILQVAYNGRPLYRYAVDEAPGDAKGDGVAGKWHVATP